MRALGRVDRIVAGAVGEPGRRTFYIEVAGDAGTEWFLVEKQQVAALADRVIELVTDLEVAPQDPGPDLTGAGEPTFRVGQIALGRDGDDLVLVLSPTEGVDDPVSATVTPEAADAMARRALLVVAAGRPPCGFCGNPKDPEGHTCPAANGDLRHQ
jgi:uncharacterized repeat protein (TIGR03847 family)